MYVCQDVSRSSLIDVQKHGIMIRNLCILQVSLSIKCRENSIGLKSDVEIPNEKHFFFQILSKVSNKNFISRQLEII